MQDIELDIKPGTKIKIQPTNSYLFLILAAKVSELDINKLLEEQEKSFSDHCVLEAINNASLKVLSEIQDV